MTTVSDSRTTPTLAIVQSVLSGLEKAFAAHPDKLLRLAIKLSRGDLSLRQRSLQIEPYIGPAGQHMRELRWLAANGNVAARREVLAITRHHNNGRYLPLVTFLRQFPHSDGQLLLGTVRDDLVGLELKLDRNGHVMDVVATRKPHLYEYSLRAFRLKLQETIEIAAWMRANEKQLCFSWKVYMPPAQRNNQRVAAERDSKLIAFFDASNFPEKMRDLLVAKARPELRHLRFDIDRASHVVLLAEGAQP